jgi:osmoprotectant transport system permease protein
MTPPSQFALGVAGVVQTIPSLALLAVMIPLLGLGVRAAIAALFLYAMLPILRNTYTGIAEVDGELVDAARGMGMRPGQILTRVQLPLAMRTIMAGIRTSTVISIGVATLAAFIGVGGLGKPITQGLYLNDTGLILLGAVPAALLAIAADVGLGRLELALQPRGLRAG